MVLVFHDDGAVHLDCAIIQGLFVDHLRQSGFFINTNNTVETATGLKGSGPPHYSVFALGYVYFDRFAVKLSRKRLELLIGDVPVGNSLVFIFNDSARKISCLQKYGFSISVSLTAGPN